MTAISWVATPGAGIASVRADCGTERSSCLMGEWLAAEGHGRSLLYTVCRGIAM